MWSRRLLLTANAIRSSRSATHHQPLARLPLLFSAQHVRAYADKVITVPQMAESISEGTLKQWAKQVGDFVEQDEEIATIETDKVSIYPPAGEPWLSHLRAG